MAKYKKGSLIVDEATVGKKTAKDWASQGFTLMPSAPSPSPVSSAPTPSKSSDTRTWGINPANQAPVSAPAPAPISAPTQTTPNNKIQVKNTRGETITVYESSIPTLIAEGTLPAGTAGQTAPAQTAQPTGEITAGETTATEQAQQFGNTRMANRNFINAAFQELHGRDANMDELQRFDQKGIMDVFNAIKAGIPIKEVMTDLGKMTIEKITDLTVGGTDVATGEVVDDLAGAGQRFGIDFEAPLEARQEAIEAGQEELDPISAQITEIQNEIQDTVEFYEAEKERIESRLAPMSSINRETFLMNQDRTAALAKLEIREAIAQGQFDRSFALIKENADLIYDMELRKLDWLKELDTREYNEAKEALANEQELALSGMIKLNMEQFQTAVAQARNQGMSDLQIEQDLFYRKPGTSDIYLRPTPEYKTASRTGTGVGTTQPEQKEAYNEPEAKQLFIKYLEGDYGLTEARERVEQITGQKVRFSYSEARQFVADNPNASAEELKPVLLEFTKGVLTVTEINALLAELKKDKKSSGREL